MNNNGIIIFQLYKLSAGGLFSPAVAVEGTVVDSFAEVGDIDTFIAGEVGDGAGNFQDAVVGAGRQTEAIHSGFH